MFDFGKRSSRALVLRALHSLSSSGPAIRPTRTWSAVIGAIAAFSYAFAVDERFGAVAAVTVCRLRIAALSRSDVGSGLALMSRRACGW